MAQKVNDNAIQFSTRNSRSGRVHVGTFPVEDDYTIGLDVDGVSVTFVKKPGPDFVSQRTLTRSTIPPKREGKRKHYPRKWAGEEQTGHTMRAIYGHVDEDGVEHEPRVVATRPEDWQGTRSPFKTSRVMQGPVEGHIEDRFWRAT